MPRTLAAEFSLSYVFWKLVRTLVSSYKDYPRLTKDSELCSYYRKYCKQAPFYFFMVAAGFFSIQIIRFTVLLFDSLPWAYVISTIRNYLIQDVIIVFTSLLIVRTLRQLSLKEKKHDIAFHRSMRLWLQACGLVPTCGIAVLPLMVRDTHDNPGIGELVNYMWFVAFTLEIQACTWLIDGIFYRVFLIGLFNTVFCITATQRGFFRTNFYGRLLFPVAISMLFFVTFDKYFKENFILRQLLKKQKNMYERFLDKIKDPLIIVDHDRLLYNNTAAKEKLGITSLEAFRSRADLIISEKGDTLGEDTIRRLGNGSPAEVTCERYFMHDERSETIEPNKQAMVTFIESAAAARAKVVFIALHDVTEEQLEDEKRVEGKYKNMLLFSLSHELRTPLNIFQAFLRVSKALMTSTEAFELHRNAKGAWWYLRNKISDILDYAQLLNGEFVLHLSTFSLRRFAGQLKKVTYGLLGQKRNNVQLEFIVDGDVRDEFRGDRERLEQVLFNFLSNAVKYTTEGKIGLAISRAKHDPRQIAFIVTDTGCGMSPESLTRLFELRSDRLSESHNSKGSSDLVTPSPRNRGKREESSKERSTGLSGLGLTTSKRICNKMGSEIRVSSEQGKGSCFSLSVLVQSANRSVSAEEGNGENCRVAEEEARINPCKLTSISPHRLFRQNKSAVSLVHAPPPAVVLVVDDTDLNRFVAKSMVRKFGFMTEEADNGMIALRKLEDIQTRMPRATIVILMDVDMPVMDGIQATIAIRKAGRQPVPFIAALTAFASEAERVKCMEAGMNDFISKPLTKEGLRSLLVSFKLLH